MLVSINRCWSNATEDLVWRDWLADTRGEQESTIHGIKFFDESGAPRFERHQINKERGMNLATLGRNSMALHVS